MRTRLILPFALLAGLACAQPLVIKRVTVVDATGKPAQPDMTVVIEGDRIAAVSRSTQAKIPKGAQVVDGTGKFLIPGLWDMHVHGAADGRSNGSYPLYLANGVLGVREMFGPPNAGEWRARHAASAKPAPSVYVASPIVDGPKPVWPGSIAVANEAQGREAVAQQKERGADFIKVYSLLPRDAYFAIADEARKRAISFVGHVPRSVTVGEASDAGQKSIEHLTGVALGCSSREDALFTAIQSATGADVTRLTSQAFETYDEAKAQALFSRFVKNGTWQCPTLTVLRSISHLDDPQFVNDNRLKYMAKGMRSFWDPKNDFRFKDRKEDYWAAMRIQYRESMKIVGAMQRAGVSILAGTDTMNPYCFPGFSLHDELALLVEAGLSPMAALQASTSNAARFMGQFDRRGTIETGKVADLVLLDKDPLADIHNTQSIQAIVLHGKLMPRTALDAMLAETEASAAK
jgi:hypothetical protein